MIWRELLSICEKLTKLPGKVGYLCKGKWAGIYTERTGSSVWSDGKS